MRALTAGSDWDRDILAHLDAADLVTMIITADFVASRLRLRRRLRRALERHELAPLVAFRDRRERRLDDRHRRISEPCPMRARSALDQPRRCLRLASSLGVERGGTGPALMDPTASSTTGSLPGCSVGASSLPSRTPPRPPRLTTTGPWIVIPGPQTGRRSSSSRREHGLKVGRQTRARLHVVHEANVRDLAAVRPRSDAGRPSSRSSSARRVSRGRRLGSPSGTRW